MLLLAVGAVAAVRLGYCASLPVNTGDILRWIHIALYVLRDGLGAAGVPLAALDPGLARLSWADVPYSYPPLALPFFVVVVALSPTLFAAKLALTLVEAANAILIARITGSRWLGVLYWASPLSIWWVSGEGQFEPLMAFFMLAGVALVRHRPILGLVLLAAGFNVKVTAILLVPWFLLTIQRERPLVLKRSVLALAIALVAPMVVATAWYPAAASLVGIAGTLRYNPYYWNPFDPTVFLWNPEWLRAINAVVTYGVLAVMIRSATRSRGAWVPLGGAIAFVVLVKLGSLAQFWYFLLFPAFVMPLSAYEGRPDLRWWLVALSPLLDVTSIIQLVFGPFGWTEFATYQGLSAFTAFHVR